MSGGDWYLKFIIVHDLQTRDKSYFLCNKWLSLNRDDCLNERILPIALSKQKSELKYLLKKETKYKLSDSHLWLSILTKPLNSTFNRTQRLTCCFTILLMNMLMNILYYDLSKKKDQNQNEFNLGPFHITLELISISIITSLIIIPPNLLLVFLFRKSTNKITKSDRLKKAMKIIKKSSFLSFNNQKKSELVKQENKRKLFALPWWFKIIAYSLSFLISLVSIFFIIIKGISLGNEKTTKWLTTIVISLFSSLILIQPLEVYFIYSKIKNLIF